MWAERGILKWRIEFLICQKWKFKNLKEARFARIKISSKYFNQSMHWISFLFQFCEPSTYIFTRIEISRKYLCIHSCNTLCYYALKSPHVVKWQDVFIFIMLIFRWKSTLTAKVAAIWERKAAAALSSATPESRENCHGDLRRRHARRWRL